MQLTKDHNKGVNLGLMTNAAVEDKRNKPLFKMADLSSCDEHPKLNIKVLMVEDDHLCQFVQRRALENYGCQVDIAGNGEQALAMFNSNYDAIVLDVNLPDISGLEVSKAIRTTKQGKTIPIIGLTSEAEEIYAQCLAAGYSQILPKPNGLQQLGNVLRAYFPIELKLGQPNKRLKKAA